MARKGGKRSKGEPAFYDEMKKRVNLSLTPTGFDGLDDLAEEWGLSKSELVEQIGRGTILVLKPEEAKRLGELSANTNSFSMSDSTDKRSTKGGKPKESRQPT